MSPTTPRMSSPSRGRPRDAGADDRIVATTFDQLVKVGYGGLSIESVAAEAGVAKTTIYRRYPTKRDLVIASLAQGTPVPSAPPELPAREGLSWLVHTMVSVLVESGAVRILSSLIVEDDREPGLMDTFRARLLAPRREMVLEMLRRGIERGELRPNVDPLVVTEMVAGAIFGHHMILGLPTTDAWLDSLVEHVWGAIEVR